MSGSTNRVNRIARFIRAADQLPKSCVPTGHRGIGGVQEHSCGEIFPYTIVVREGVNGNHNQGYVYAMEGGSGEILEKHFYDLEEINSFEEAHRAAEADAYAAIDQE